MDTPGSGSGPNPAARPDSGNEDVVPAPAPPIPASSDAEAHPVAALLERARQDDPAALGALSETIRNYLLLIANQEMDPELNRVIGPSDLVQNTMLSIHEHIKTFRGSDGAAFLAWARQILHHDLIRAHRHYKEAARRDLRRDRSMADHPPGDRPPAWEPTAIGPTPHSESIRREIQAIVEEAMTQLPEDSQRVIRLRTDEQFSFAEIGRRLNRSEDAAQKLWMRSIERLKAELKKRHVL